MKDKNLLSKKQYYLIKTVYVITIILSIVFIISFASDISAFIYGTANNLLTNFSPQYGYIVILFNYAFNAILMFIFAVNKSMNCSKNIKIVIIILIISNILVTLFNYNELLLSLFLYLAFYILSFLFVLFIFNQNISIGRKIADFLFVILFISVIGSITYILVTKKELSGIGNLILAFILYKSYKDKGFYKYFIETHPKYLIKGQKYFY